MRWWSSRGALASHEKDENCKLLRQATQWWGRRVVHIFDRGYANGPWLGALRGFDVRFIVRVARSITTWELRPGSSKRLGKSRAAKWAWHRARCGMPSITATCKAVSSSFPLPILTFLIGH